MENEDILVNIKDGVMHVTLNRPESLNSFSPDMISGLSKAISDAQESTEVKVMIISGAGRSFSAGGDVKTMGQATALETYEHIGKLNQCIASLQNSKVPIIAAVHGYAAGAGFNLALACDLIIAEEGSKFAMSFSQVGLVSDGGGSYFLPRLTGPYLAKKLFFSGEPIEAQKLYELGILHSVVPARQLKEDAENLAIKLAQGPGIAYAKMKQLIHQSYTSSLEEMLEQERMTQTLMIATEDHLEGICAFKEKRKPVFKGK
ncbi:enoyl-CoA hydratase [Bacillus sp. MUM 13]|uniref:enoyl-CoA hydratase/isomerase family protein n=1 Tax=Bacillus sp. MUM 13 TaxID=1678001 RepID=UPI0008F5A0DF|nr:enoyl-CoA hydratase [Bacillus sp. MUM 13]OIK14497.1 enoyl-CoA hydratase [Bacillus sp. MUM 13]